MSIDPSQLEALLQREQKSNYQRQDYLSKTLQASASLRRNNPSTNNNDDAFLKTPSATTTTTTTPRAVSPTPQEAPPSPRSVTSKSTATTSSSSSILKESNISESWRERICTWKFHVVDHYNLDRDIVSISMHYLDRYLAIHHYTIDTDSFLLAAVASIHLAIKLYVGNGNSGGGETKIPTMTCIAIMSRGMVNPENLELMEMDILESLDWHLHPPTPCSFICHLRPILSVCIGEEEDGYGTTTTTTNNYNGKNILTTNNCGFVKDIMDFATFLIEITVCKYNFIKFKPSIIAMASILCGMEYLKIPSETRLRTKDFVTSRDVLGYQSNDLKDLELCHGMLREFYHLAMPLFDVSCWDLNWRGKASLVPSVYNM